MKTSMSNRNLGVKRYSSSAIHIIDIWNEAVGPSVVPNSKGHTHIVVRGGYRILERGGGGESR